MSPFSLANSPPPTLPNDRENPLQLKIDYSSKGLTDVRPFPTQLRSPWVQGGNATRVLSGLARTNRRRLKRWEDEGFDSGTGPDGGLRVAAEEEEQDGQGRDWQVSSESSSSSASSTVGRRDEAGEYDEDEDDEDKVDVYYQIFVGPDHAAIRTFHSDKARHHDLLTNGFPYLQTHLAFLDDLQYSGLWTITEIPSSPPPPAVSLDSAVKPNSDDESALLTSSDNMASSSLLASPADGPSRSDSMEEERRGKISPGRLSSFDSDPGSLNENGPDIQLQPDHKVIPPRQVVPPVNLREYWRSNVFPLRHDDLATLGSSEVRFKITESLHRDGRSSAIKDVGPSSFTTSARVPATPSRPSRLARDLTEEMLDGGNRSPLDDSKDGKTPMNHGPEQSKEFPFDGRSEGTETPVNRSRSPNGEVAHRSEQEESNKETAWNRAYYIKAVEVLIALAELVKELQERRLCIAICRPEVFAVKPSADTGSLSPISLALHTVSHLKPISRYDHGRRVVRKVYETNMGAKPASAGVDSHGVESMQENDDPNSEDHPINQAYVESAGIVRREIGLEEDIFDEATIQLHLAYIAPETVSEPDFGWGPADVYSWGSCAYDLLTDGLAEFLTPSEEPADLLRNVHDHSTRARTPLRDKIKDCPLAISGLIEKTSNLDADTRYTGMASLLCDLRKIHDELCEGQLPNKSYLGRVDGLSRYSTPSSLLERQLQTDTINRSFGEVSNNGKIKTVCFYGESGTGKSKQVETWCHERIRDRTAGKLDFLLGWAKMDQHQVRPLSGMVNIFEMLLAAIFSNPHENASVWKSLILDALPGLGNMFLDLLSPTWRDLLLGKRPEKDIDAVDWDTYSQRFKIWARNLFTLFAAAGRPLVIVIDDWQWMEATERELWTELFENKPLENTMVLITYRLENGQPLDMSPLKHVESIESLPFSEETIDHVLVNGFHLEEQKPEDGFSVLSSFLYNATRGNPLFLKFLLTRLIKDDVVCFDYDLESWQVATEMLPYYSTSGIEEFARWTLSRLSTDIQSVLRILSCLPAQGASLDLVSRLFSKPLAVTRTAFEKARLYGIVRITEGVVAFTHDRHQEAARALIADKDRPRFLANMARKLEMEGPDMIFVRADLLADALPMENLDWSSSEISDLMLDAAHKSIRSAAFDAAYRYLRSANESLPVLKAETWETNRENCQRICILATAIASGLRDTEFAFSAIGKAYELALTVSEKITAATLCVRLHLLAYNLEGVYAEVDRIFPLIGMEYPIKEHIQNPKKKWVQKCPVTSEDLLSLVDASAEHLGADEVHATGIALAAFMVACGPTIYTRLSGRAVQWMDHATAQILRSREALKHPASGYLLGVRSILFVAERQYDLAAAYMDLGLTVPWRDTPWQGSSEIPYKAIEFLRAKSISSIDYSGTWNAAALSNSTDILIYISAIELGALGLSGRSVPLILERGQASLVQLKQDLPQAIRPFLASFAQLALNLIDTQRNPLEMYRLEGDAMSWGDEAVMGDHGDTIGVSFYMTALLNAVLFSAPVAFARDLATKAKRHEDGWRGLIGHFSYLNAMCWYLLAYDVEDNDILHEAHEAYAAFPLNVDFQALRSVLFALQSLKKLRQKKMMWSDALLHVEAAVKAVSMTPCHLATGWLCLNAARTFLKGANLSKRIWGGFALDANQAFLRCGAVALSRQVITEFPESFNLAKPAPSIPVDAGLPSRDRMPKIDSPTTSSSDVTSNSGDTKRSLFASDEITTGLSQRLNIEGILKSFLAFATEKDSKMLIKRVLGILIQITRADSGFLALQNASTNTLHLRGGGLHSRIHTYDMPVSDAASVCPSSVLLHAAHTRKPVDSTDMDQTPLLRDNYFSFPTAKHILAVPLFIQNQLAGVICMQGSLLRFSSSVKSHVELLATFAAIVLESHDMTASLEQSVRLRTTQLEQALTHRQTFISSITHELRTPLHSISGLTAIMENSSDLPEAQKENVAGIRSSAEDLQRIITDVLDLSKLENGSMQIETVSFDLRQVAEAALDSVANLAHAKNLEVLLDNTIDSDPPTHILGDPFRIKQCLLNLLGNAIRFTETGEIRLGWTLESSPVGGESLVFSVTDTGIGIPVDSRQRLFQPFSQVDASIQRKWGGTGLGLSITFNLAQTMGGTAWCESVEGKGSTFFFSVIVQRDTQTKIPKMGRDVVSHVLLIAPSTKPTTIKLACNLEQMNARTTVTTPGQISRYLDGVTAVMLDSAYSEAVPFFKRLANERPEIKITFLAELTDKAALLSRLSDPKARVITKPIKVQAIYDFLHTSSSGSEGDPAVKRVKPVTVIDKDTARRHPLDILFVDDNPINRAVGLKVLKKFGYNFVAVATNGAEAVDAAENALYDLILMDLQMPVMDGHTAMAKILESEKAGKPQIVALTANADTATRELCLQQGFHGFLGKPLVIRELDTVFEAAHQVKIANKST